MNGQRSEPPPPVPEAKPIHRAWSLYLMTVAGIPIYLHFTFLLLLAFIALVQINSRQMVYGGMLFVLFVFASVILHELGHALTARRFGIKTDDIVLYPIGGVARLRSMGEGFQEFWIAIAGPLVNVAIALLIYLYLKATGQWIHVPIEFFTRFFTDPDFSQMIMAEVSFLQKVMFVNIILIFFNMVPAFPMDGGRVLRALLARRLSKARATDIAAKIGQALAIIFFMMGMGMFGFRSNFLLMFIGLFVFLAAGQEAAATRSAALMAGKLARDAMITQFNTLAHSDSLGRAADLLVSTSQQDFPVIGGNEVVGVLSRKALIQGLATHGRDHYVAEVMDRAFPRMGLHDDLVKVFERLHEAGGSPVLIFEGPSLAGYINQENLMEYMLIAQTGRPMRRAE